VKEEEKNKNTVQKRYLGKDNLYVHRDATTRWVKKKKDMEQHSEESICDEKRLKVSWGILVWGSESSHKEQWLPGPKSQVRNNKNGADGQFSRLWPCRVPLLYSPFRITLLVFKKTKKFRGISHTGNRPPLRPSHRNSPILLTWNVNR